MIQRARAFYATYVRDFFARYWFSVLAIAGALALLVLYISPAPPDHIEIATGADEDAYRAFAERYRAALARDNITLNLVPTTGAPENLQRLNNGDTGIDAAFLQDGLTTPENSPHLYSLGSLYYDPLWIFYRTGIVPKGAPGAPTKASAAKAPPAAPPERLAQLEGLRIAMGAGHGGTRQLAMRLLMASGVNQDNSQFVAVGGREAADALLAGKVDVAMFLTTLDAPWVQQLLVSPGIGLMSLDQSDALARNFPFLHEVVLPHGAIDMGGNIPPRDTRLVAPTVTLVVRDDLHPALAGLLLKAAIEVHGKPSLLNREGEFPADRDADLPLHPEAARYFKSGPPLLQKYLPFWLATWVDRMAIVLVPILALLIPLIKLAPAVYGWRVRARVYHWYGELKFLEVQLRDSPETASLPRVLERLDWIENQVNRIRLPLSFSNHLYFLREHIELVRNAIRRHAAQSGLDPAAIRAAEQAAAAKTARDLAQEA
ncbi:MAG TPA: TAXI family TRAP transporter solute-binding subunit [Burkholderiales bacterium]